MRRKTFDALLTSAGAVLALVLLVAGGLLLWSSSYTHHQVSDQLAAQQIYFPAAGSDSINDPAVKPHLEQYAGQQLTTGVQAQAYADHFIQVHLNEMTQGRTYAQVSADAMASPTDAKKAELVQTVFRGTTLRSMLLSAYAFDTIATVLFWGGLVSMLGALLLLILVGLGARHLRRASDTADLRIGHAAPIVA